MSGRSLRTRLIAAFAAVIFLTLLIVGIGFIFVLGQYQEQRELLRLGTLAGPVTFQVRALEQQGAPAAEIADFLARQSDDVDVRIVLATRDGVIFHDTDGTLVGQRIALPAAQRIGPLRRASLLTVEGQQGGRIVFVATALQPPTSSLPERFLGRQSAYLVALASEPLTILRVIREMAPRLVLAALVSLLASVGVAWLLAGSIARPLARMTRAAEEMARGRYDQEIPSQGAGEIGRLATAFNTMAREVARSNRALRDFVANVSHDLRTPLTSIQGFSQAMVDGAIRQPEEFALAGRIVNEEAGRMRRLVEDLLELSRIESGQETLEAADVDLAQLARRAREPAARDAAEGGIELIVRIDAAPTVRGDSRRLERALDNLLGNAIKHTPPDGVVTLAVGVTGPASDAAPARDGQPSRRPAGIPWSGRLFRRGDDGAPRDDGAAPSPGWASVPSPALGRGAHAVVRVHNTGSLIPAEDLPRIFERFYQVDKSRVGAAAGSGLGLAIAREIIQAHGGRIDAESSPAGGTEFSILLPLLDPTGGAGIASVRRAGLISTVTTPAAAPRALESTSQWQEP